MLYGATVNTLTALNLKTRTVAWLLPSLGIGTQPAFSAGVLYVLNGNGTILEARDPASGTLQWASNDLADQYTQVIVAGNLAFVASGSTTLAIDLATHKTVWTYPLGGKLSISNRGVLYIVSPQKLAAVNLR